MPDAKTIARLVGVVLVIVLGLAVAANVAGFLSDPFGFGRRRLHQAEGAAAQATGAAAVAKGQVGVAGDAAAILDRGRDRETIIERIRESNHDAIAAAPGAAQPLDPGLLDTARRGLCQYAAYAADPGCLDVRGPGAAELP